MKKEKILKTLILISANTYDINNIKKFIVNVIGRKFNADRCFIRDYDSEIYDFLPLDPKDEYLSSNNIKSLSNFCLLPEAVNLINSLRKNNGLLFSDDIDDFIEKNNLKNTIFEMHVKQFSIKSGILQFIITFKNETLGIFALHYVKNKHKLNNEDLDFIKTVIYHTGIVIYQLKLYEKIKQLRSTFMMTIAHELQVPVVGEKLALEFINSRHDNMPVKEIKPIINEIIDNNHKINNILSMLIDIYAYESGEKRLNYKEQKIDKLVKDIYKKFKIDFESKSIKVNFVIKNLLPIIKVDKLEIEKTFDIIFKNALEHTPNNGEIAIEIYKYNKYIIINISDNGPGFSMEMEKMVFKRYESLKILSRKIGMGLNLYLAKLIITEHNGLIKINSKKMLNTTISIYLPIINRE